MDVREFAHDYRLQQSLHCQCHIATTLSTVVIETLVKQASRRAGKRGSAPIPPATSNCLLVAGHLQ